MYHYILIYSTCDTHKLPNEWLMKEPSRVIHSDRETGLSLGSC